MKLFTSTLLVLAALLASACGGDARAQAPTTTAAPTTTTAAPIPDWELRLTVGSGQEQVEGSVPLDAAILSLLRDLDTAGLDVDERIPAPAWLAPALAELVALDGDGDVSLAVRITGDSVIADGRMPGLRNQRAFERRLGEVVGRDVTVELSLRSTFAADLADADLKVFFLFGETIPEGDPDPVVRAVARLLDTYPDACVEVLAFTDERGGGHDVLSQGRADAVALLLVGAGIAPDRIRATGMGADDTGPGDDDPVGYAAARRAMFRPCPAS